MNNPIVLRWLIALQALILVLLAASDGRTETLTAADGGGEKGTAGVSNYLQPYQVPIAGDVAPIKPSIYNDEFDNQKPWVVGMEGSFVQPSAKWIAWDPGAVLSLSAVDPRYRMLQLQGVGDKEWAGRYQALPIPAVGQAISYAIYSRCLNAFTPSGDFTGLFWGMLFGENLQAEPATSGLLGAYSRLARVGTSLEGNTECAEFAAYDSPGVVEANIASGWPLQFFRAIVQSSAAVGPVYTTSVRFDASQDGIGWQRLHTFSGLDYAVRHVALAQRSSGEANFSSYFDYIRATAVNADEIDILLLGAAFQQLGSV